LKAIPAYCGHALLRRQEHLNARSPMSATWLTIAENTNPATRRVPKDLSFF
jgi:hypothetical protein